MSPRKAQPPAQPSKCQHGRDVADCYACRPIRPVPKSTPKKGGKR